MRAVLDTNILVSAFLFDGIPLDILDLAEHGIIELFSSESAIMELEKVLARPQFRKRLESLHLSAPEIAKSYGELTTIVTPSEPPHICPDPDDEEFIGIALAAEADVIVSGDRHLLGCGDSSPVPVMSASEFAILLRQIL